MERDSKSFPESKSNDAKIPGKLEEPAQGACIFAVNPEAQAPATLNGVVCCRFVGGLSGLHIFFTSQNTTTYEHFRSRYNAQGNPYDVGLVGNWKQVFCQRMAPRLPEKIPGRVRLNQSELLNLTVL